MTRGMARGKVRVELAENNVEDEGGKDGAERTTFGEAFKLAEAVPRGVRCKIPAGISISIKQVKKWNKGVEHVVTGEDVMGQFMRSSIEHVFKIQEEHGMGWCKLGCEGARDELFKHDAVEVDNGVYATVNPDTKLTTGKEMSSKVRG
jgi:hypothetical protein